MNTKLKRVIQFMFGAIFLTISMAVFVAGIRAGSAAGMFGALIPLFFGLVPVGMLELQIRGIRTAGARVRAQIEECAKSVFEAPGAVRPGYDITATAGPVMAAFASEADNDAAFTTDGNFRGASVSVASHVSVVGRQVGELHHTYSHVVVDVLGLDRSFRISKERASAKIAKAIGAMKDVTIGDEAFDKTFVVSTDDALAKDVLDDSIRKRLLELQAQVANVSVDYGTGGMSILLTKRGLALRWPGEINPQLAAFVRDLLLDMREKILAHENRVAVRVGTEASGYRVAPEPELAAPPSEEPEVVRARDGV